MPTRNVVLTDHLSDYIDTQVASGRYQNASEVIRAGLRSLEDSQARVAAFFDELLEEAERGDFVEGHWEDVVNNAFAEAKARYEQRQSK